ncbi:MAG TPA: hypothetical protein VED37_09590 [Ktedonobacteraceae bacterium]|nr:hypothetical protein [Ktedonobacteraceae bacterium]
MLTPFLFQRFVYGISTSPRYFTTWSVTIDVYAHVLSGMQQDAMRQLDAALIKQARPEKEVG